MSAGGASKFSQVFPHLFELSSSTKPRIFRFDIVGEITGLARDDGEPMMQSGGSEQAIHHIKVVACSFVFRIQFPPDLQQAH